MDLWCCSLYRAMFKDHDEWAKFCNEAVNGGMQVELSFDLNVGCSTFGLPDYVYRLNY